MTTPGGSNSAYFQFGTNINQVVSQVESGLKQIIAAVDSVGNKTSKSGSLNLSPNDFLSGIQAEMGQLSEGALQGLKSITDQFKKAASSGKTTVNGQNLTQALKTFFADVNQVTDGMVKGFTTSIPKDVGTGDVSKIIDSGLRDLHRFLEQAVKTEFDSIKQIGKGAGLKSTAFGQPTSGAVQAAASSLNVVPAFTADQQALDKLRQNAIAFLDDINGATVLTRQQRTRLNQSARNGATNADRFGPFAFQGANGEVGVKDPRTGEATVVSGTGANAKIGQLNAAAAASIQTGTKQAQQWAASQAGSAHAAQQTAGAAQQQAQATQAAATAAQQTATNAQAAAAAWDAAKLQAQQLAQGLRNGQTQRFGSYYFNGGRVFRTQSRNTIGADGLSNVEEGATQIRNPLELQRLRDQLVSSQAKQQDSVPHEKTAYDEFLRGFFGAGGRKRTGGASPIDTTNPLAGFTETAGIVAKYELQGRAIQALSGDIHDAVTQYFALDQATREYDNMLGQGGAANAHYISTLENISNAAGIGVVQALQAATRGVAAFAQASDSVQQKNAIGQQFATQTAKLSVVSGLSSDDSQNALVAIGSAYGQKRLDRAINSIAVGKEGAADPGQVAEAVADVAQTAKQAGFSVDDITQAVAVAQASSHKQGTQIGADFGRIIDNFTSGQSKTALAGVGVDVTGNVKDQLFSLAKVYPTLNDVQQRFISHQLGGAKAIETLMPLLNGQGKLQQQLTRAITDTDAADKQYAANVGSLAGQAKKFGQELKSLGVDLARTGVLTPLLLIAKVLETVVEFADKAVQAFDDFGGAGGDSIRKLTASVLGLLAVMKLVGSARGRLTNLAPDATSTGRGVTGILANRIGHRRIIAGRDYRTGARLDPAAAEEQRRTHGVSRNPLAQASQQAATQIQRATTQHVTAEERLIAILDRRIEAEEAMLAAQRAGKVPLVHPDRGVPANERPVPVNLNHPNRPPIGTPVPRPGSLGRLGRSISGSRLGQAASRFGRAANRFAGGAQGLFNGALIASVGYGAITSTLKGTDSQLQSERDLKEALGSTDFKGSASDIRDAAGKLNTSANTAAKSSSGARGVATEVAESLGQALGFGHKDDTKNAERDAKEIAERMNNLADTIDKLNESGSKGDFLSSLVDFSNLDALNTSITNLQNTGASGTDVFIGLTKALNDTATAANGAAVKLGKPQQAIVAAKVGAAVANRVNDVNATVADDGGLNPGGLANVGLGGQKLENFLKKLTGTKGFADAAGSAAQSTITDYLSANPNFDPSKGGKDAKELEGLIEAKLSTLPEFSKQGKNKDQQKAIDTLVHSLGIEAITNLKTSSGDLVDHGLNGPKAASLPTDFGKQIATILQQSQAYHDEALTAFQNGSSTYVDAAKAATGKTGAASLYTLGKETLTDQSGKALFSATESPEVAAAKLKQSADQHALDLAKQLLAKNPKDANALTKLGQAQKQVDADTQAVLAGKIQEYQQLGDIAASNENTEDKVAQDLDHVSAIQKQLSQKMSDWQRAILEGTLKAAKQTTESDTLEAANAVADANVQVGNSLDYARQQAVDAASVFEQLDAREKNNAVKSKAWADAKRDAQDKYYAAIQTGVEVSNSQALANIDPRNVAAVQQQTLDNLRASLAATNDPGQRAQLQQQINQQLQSIAEGNVAQANAALEASAYPGDPLADASNKLQEAKNNLSKDLFLTTQWLQDYLAFKAAVVANATAIANANLTHSELTQDLTDPVQQAKNAVKGASDKLDIDRFFHAPKAVTDADKVDLQQKVSAEEAASFTQRLGFIQTDFQLYRTTLPQYIQKLKDLRATIKGNSIQAINERNQIDQDLLSAYQQGSGQFNIGDIKLPTLYQARRQGLLAGQVTTKDLANAGQKAINDGTNFQNVFQPLVDQLGQIQTRGAVVQLSNLQSAISALGFGPTATAKGSAATTNHITINGADFAKVVAYLAQALGVNATSTRTAISTRKV